MIGEPYRIRVPDEWLKPHNVLTVEVSNLMANRMAYLDQQGALYKKFYNINFPARKRENRGADGLFSAASWTPRPSGLLGPVRLVPVFQKQPQ